MPIVSAVKNGFRNYFVYKTRAHRRDFWFWFLFVVGAQLILAQAASGVGAIVSYALIIPHFMYGIRRMHDTNRSGWWILLPIVNLVFWAQPGTSGENRFGPPPPPLPQ